MRGNGGCMCGAVRYAFDPEAVLRQGLCHCEDCRRATASPVTAFVMVRETALRWTRGAPRLRESSPGVTRGHCAACGTPLLYASPGQPGEAHLYAATLDAPEEAAPDRHWFWSERLPWLDIEDDRPKEG